MNPSKKRNVDPGFMNLSVHYGVFLGLAVGFVTCEEKRTHFNKQGLVNSGST